MRLSIVIPTHETRAITLACVASLAARRADDEVIVIDDGADGTYEAIAGLHPEVRVRRHERTEGFTASANEGLSAASGDLLLVLNSDTLVEAGALEALRTAFERDAGLGIGSPVLTGADGSRQWVGGNAPTLAWLFVLSTGLAAAFRRRWGARGATMSRAPEWVTGAAMVMRREVWEAHGPFDSGFRFYAQDLELCLRVREAGWRIGVVPEARVVHFGGASVGRLPGAFGGANPAWLWADLLRWAERHHGREWARCAARLMWLGSGLRLARRMMRRVGIPRSGRAAWDADTEALRAARRAVGALQRTVE